ncbi:MAG TPA: N,N-dimethylformamidase beta subunit family domain-containing protein [Burkholderiales bacterium]|nr:N,N-dimethylformamidase beta subunit family domain-containing protein [Burkholderiales bacterium]
MGFAVPALSQTINTVAGGSAGDGGAATSASLSAGGVALGISQAQSGPVVLESATKWTRRCRASSCRRAPTVTIDKAAGQADPTGASPINFTAVFSKRVSGFSGAGVTISGTAGGTKTGTVSGGPSTYNVAVSGMSSAGTVIASIPAGVAQDAAGDANTASTSTDNSVSFTPPDTTPPSVTINQAAGQADPTNASPINFTAVFSEPVSGFTGAGVSISGTAGGTKTVTVSGGPSTYNMAVSGMSSAGTVIASIAAGVVTDAAGNPSTASTSTDNSVSFTFVSPVVLENQQLGSGNWQMWLRGIPPADDVNQQIKGYASATSANLGESITFYVTVNPAQQYTMDVYRMGWYQGLGGRLMQSIGPLQGVAQPACPVDAVTGLIECDWTAAYTLTVPPTWTSGVFMVQLTNAQGYQNYITFVVRDDARVADIMFQQAVATYQAYNNYPDDNATGKSLYFFNSHGANTVAGAPKAVKVSWNRPYTAQGTGQFFKWDYHFVRWLERSGYDVKYSTDVDTHENSERLLNSKVFLSGGHNEYWSKAMYDGVQQARDAGVHLAFFGADAVYWQVRFEASPLSGAADRVLVGYKDRTTDPVQGPTTTVLWRDPFLNRPEQQLMGVQFSGSIDISSPNAPYVVQNSSSWVYAGTGLADGDSIPGIVGYEMDASMSGYPLPTSVAGTYQVLSQSPFTDSGGTTMTANSSIYQAPSGAWVFGAGTVSWSFGLDLDGVVDPRIQRITANLLGRFGASPQP